MPRTPPDWNKTGTVAGYSEWLRKSSDALAVIVVRRDDAVLATCNGVKAVDLGERILEDVPALMVDLPKARIEKRPARVVHEALHE